MQARRSNWFSSQGKIKDEVNIMVQINKLQKIVPGIRLLTNSKPFIHMLYRCQSFIIMCMKEMA